MSCAFITGLCGAFFWRLLIIFTLLSFIYGFLYYPIETAGVAIILLAGMLSLVLLFLIYTDKNEGCD